MAKGPKATKSVPVITTHHTLPAGGAPGGSSDESPTATAGGTVEPVLTRPKKLILQPLHESVDADSKQEESSQEPAKKLDHDNKDEPLVLESAADAEASASKGAAKPAELPTDKIELPLEDVDSELQDEPVAVSSPKASNAADEPASAADDDRPEAKDPGEGAAAKQAVDPNVARNQKAEALMVSGKYQVRIHESTRSRTGFTIGLVAAAVVLLMFAYYAAAEQMIDVGFDVPAFWR